MQRHESGCDIIALQSARGNKLSQLSCGNAVHNLNVLLIIAICGVLNVMCSGAQEVVHGFPLVLVLRSASAKVALQQVDPLVTLQMGLLLELGGGAMANAAVFGAFVLALGKAVHISGVGNVVFSNKSERVCGSIKGNDCDNGKGVVLPNPSPHVKVELAAVRKADLSRIHPCVAVVDNFFGEDFVIVLAELKRFEQVGCCCRVGVTWGCGEGR